MLTWGDKRSSSTKSNAMEEREPSFFINQSKVEYTSIPIEIKKSLVFQQENNGDSYKSPLAL